ncbi:GSCFA domain-containing protein [Halosquirtibacter xylanolyticus]|uniref:GSCFA domain-containing protein n=1 Tax=Halosquirtibacter xylanolyticus TaxID=3374599 RepID=UPI00374798E6|nr:GSCFA domain-containing protein [Prolixibacteraceae bacterium]
MDQFDIFRTPIKPLEVTKKIGYEDKVMLLGSCFTNNIGSRLSQNLFNTLINPLGILYNPSSIMSLLDRIIDKNLLNDSDISWLGNSYGSFEFHSDFNDRSVELSLSKINRAIERAHEYLKSCQHLFITFGTAYIYEHKMTGRVVGNCHKQPEKEFKRFRLSPNDIIMEWANLLKRIWDLNPNLQVTLTVSPIRHLRDGHVENQLSKASLLLAVDRLRQGFSERNIGYFPTYEIMMDDLRDYRFYDKDMVHPSELAIDYIWSLYSNTYFDDSTRQLIKEINKIVKSANHRPNDTTSESHQKFIKKQLDKIEVISKRCPAIDLDEIIHQFRQNLHE